MGLPTPDCNIPLDVCCLDAFDVANHLLTHAFDAVIACLPAPCDQPQAYVTVGRGDDGIVDALTVALISIGPIPGATSSGPFFSRATFDVRLRESGWPIVTAIDGTISMPDPIEQNRLARHVFGHCEAIYRKLIWLMQNRQITPVGVRTANTSVSPMTLLTPQGGVVGGFSTVTVDMV